MESANKKQMGQRGLPILWMTVCKLIVSSGVIIPIDYQDLLLVILCESKLRSNCGDESIKKQRVQAMHRNVF